MNPLNNKVIAFFMALGALLLSCNIDYKLEFKSNNISRKYGCLIDSLTQNDTIHIAYATMGCFHYYTEDLTIYRNADSLFAVLKTTLPNSDKNIEPMKQYLSDSSILAYARFEKEGKKLKTNDGCTTREQYIISLHTDSIQFEDNGCEYDGYQILKYKIFGRAVVDKYYENLYQ